MFDQILVMGMDDPEEFWDGVKEGLLWGVLIAAALVVAIIFAAIVWWLIR